jgi:hypothetical protein
MSLLLERDPNGPTAQEDAGDFLYKYRENSQLNVYHDGELNLRLATLKVIEPGVVLSKKVFTKKIMEFPLIHNELCRFYIRFVRPNNHHLFHLFYEQPQKLSDNERQLVLDLIVKEFVDFVFCEVSLKIWPGLSCSPEQIWKQPAKEWMTSNQLLMTEYSVLDYDVRRFTENDLNANECVDFTYRIHCYKTGDPYAEKISATLTTTVQKVLELTIGSEHLATAIEENGKLSGPVTFAAIEKATELVLRSWQVMEAQLLRDSES